jgi:hypothetical protein
MSSSDHQQNEQENNKLINNAIHCLQFLGCPLQEVDTQHITLPIKIEFQYSYDFYISIKDTALIISVELNKSGSIEYLEDVFGHQYEFEDLGEYFSVSCRVPEEVALNIEALSALFISMKKKAAIFVN